MLNRLLKRVKQQKQDSLSSYSRQQENRSQQSTDRKQLVKLDQNPYKQTFSVEQLREQIALRTLPGIQRVRYGKMRLMPNIWQQVVDCPISTFHHLPHGKRKVKQIDLTINQHRFPQYLQFIRSLLTEQLPTYNHLLINHYPNNMGIMHHTDGPAYKDKVFVISLGGPAIINFTPANNQPQENDFKVVKVLLEDKSLHIFQGDSYNKYLHGIQNYAIDSVYFYQRQGRILRSSISNFYSIQPQVLQMLSKKEFEKQNLVLTPIQQGQQYNWKLQIQRGQRISITIRQKYTS